MARSTYFFTKKKLNEILKLYGGGYRWTLHEELSEKRQISYMDKKGCMLTINEAYEGKNGQFTYVEVRISDANGKIIRKDRFDFTHTNTDDIEFVYSEENGHFYSDFRKVGMTMARATKESKIKELEERVKSLQESLEILSKRNNEMAQRAEDSFLNSPTYYQMQERMDFYKTLADLNQSHIDSQRKWRYRQDDAVQQVYADNKRLMEQAGGEYFIGITEGEHSEREYEKLREEIRELKGKLDGKNLNLVARDKMIDDMMIQIADLKAENKALKKSDADIEAEPRLDSTEDEFTQIQRLSKNIVTLKHKLSTLRADLKREMQRKYDSYSESDETSYTALLSVNKVMEHLLEESNATHDRLVEEIKTLREKIGHPEQETTTTDTEKALQEQIESLQTQLRKAEGQCKVYEANVKKLSERREEIAKLLGEARQKISELESQRDAIFTRNSNPDMVTMYHALEDRYNTLLEKLRITNKKVKELQNEKKSAPVDVKTTTTTTGTGKVGRPKTTDETRQKVIQMKSEGASYRKIAETLNISLGTVTNIINKYKV